jgi:osmoprotectant transport system permease protein
MKCLLLALLCALVVSGPVVADDPSTIRVGSKSFTESVVLGELLTHLIRQSGTPVEHRSELGGTQILWQALLQGDIDVYVDYTGTIREELLADVIEAGTEIRTDEDMRRALAKKSVAMSSRIGFNNTYALGMKEALAERLDIKMISDLTKHPELELGLSDEFMERNDGWHQLAKKYRLPHKKIRTMDHNLAYRGIEHDAIQLTDLYTTDAEIEFYRLRVLEDDRGFFPTYYAVILMRDDLAKRAPKAVEAVLRLENAVASQEMAAMTARVRLDRQLEANAAADFLNQKFQLGIDVQATDNKAYWGRFTKRLIKNTLEHLFLVAISLTLAIVVAIPLGILAARNEAFAQTVLGIVGVIQTLPSMALLVFMIPLFGLGAIPAIAALFFYSPITHRSKHLWGVDPDTDCDTGIRRGPWIGQASETAFGRVAARVAIDPFGDQDCCRHQRRNGNDRSLDRSGWIWRTDPDWNTTFQYLADPSRSCPRCHLGDLSPVRLRDPRTPPRFPRSASQ